MIRAAHPLTRMALAAAIAAAPLAVAAAASLQIVKSSSVVSDQVNTVNPRALPGADVDFALTVTNPGANSLAAVGSVTVTDTIPATARLRVGDYGAAGSGPVSFADGNLLGAGLTGSGLTYTFKALGNTTDGLEFSDGTSWSYVPVADADGYDGKVRAIRVTLAGNQVSGTAFQLKYRVRLR